MELKNVVPAEGFLGELHFIGEAPDQATRNWDSRRGSQRVIDQAINCYSLKEGVSGNVVIRLPLRVSVSRLEYDDRIILVNPVLTAEARVLNGYASVDYVIKADDVVKA